MSQANQTHTITFDSSVKKQVLLALGKGVDEEGYLVEKDNPSARILTRDGDEIHIEEFAGVYKGSEIFVKSDIASLIELADHL